MIRFRIKTCSGSRDHEFCDHYLSQFSPEKPTEDDHHPNLIPAQLPSGAGTQGWWSTINHWQWRSSIESTRRHSKWTFWHAILIPGWEMVSRANRSAIPAINHLIMQSSASKLQFARLAPVKWSLRLMFLAWRTADISSASLKRGLFHGNFNTFRRHRDLAFGRGFYEIKPCLDEFIQAFVILWM